jgi:hypothetical protein
VGPRASLDAVVKRKIASPRNFCCGNSCMGIITWRPPQNLCFVIGLMVIINELLGVYVRNVE